MKRLFFVFILLIAFSASVLSQRDSGGGSEVSGEGQAVIEPSKSGSGSEVSGGGQSTIEPSKSGEESGKGQSAIVTPKP
ncbi:hypothetical protein F8M41_008174 [Gigaspora margarita]|uniref:Secreted protein n=1 Tax=Gigaspora margarita TaxID=4874 RepID=A0A8H4A2J2_GIGMA|nr:hypothetical protein F8M41_008174 [Gigaspora margarita]